MTEHNHNQGFSGVLRVRLKISNIYYIEQNNNSGKLSISVIHQVQFMFKI